MMAKLPTDENFFLPQLIDYVPSILILKPETILLCANKFHFLSIFFAKAVKFGVHS